MIRYSVRNARMIFEYEESGFETWGFIPEKIILCGDGAIGEYVNKKIEQHKKMRTKKLQEMPKPPKNPLPYFLCIAHDGKTLEGKIKECTKYERSAVTIMLERPSSLQGSEDVVMCFGVAMSGNQIFRRDGGITEWTINKARETLVEIYEKNKNAMEKKRKNSELSKIAKRLNKE